MEERPTGGQSVGRSCSKTSRNRFPLGEAFRLYDRVGSTGDHFRSPQNRPLLRGKQSSYVGFRRRAQFSTELFPLSGAKPTFWRVVDLVWKAKSGSGLLGRLVCAKLDVVIGDMHLFRDRVLISDTARLSDDQLVESMAQGDPERERAARRCLLGLIFGVSWESDSETGPAPKAVQYVYNASTGTP